MEAKPRDVHVLGATRYFQQLQDAHALSDMTGTDPACLASEVEFFGPFMPKAADHSFDCKRCSLRCQLNSCLFQQYIPGNSPDPRPFGGADGLADVPLGVLGDVEQQADHSGGEALAADGA